MNPTDRAILTVLADGRRQNRTNLIDLIDKNRDYLSTRISALREEDLIRTIGPAERSGLYEITAQGRARLRGRDIPAPGEQTRSQPCDPHLSPLAFELLSILDTPYPTPDLIEELNEPREYLRYLIDGLAYQGLVAETEVTITTQHADVAVSERSRPAWLRTDRGTAVLDHRDVWVEGGDRALAEALDS